MLQLFGVLDEFYIKPEELETQTINNIEGRFYPDGEYVDSLLPSSYKIPANEVQKCGNCVFHENGFCKAWKAQIRKNYWCKSWKVSIDAYEDMDVEEFIANALQDEEEAVILEQINVTPYFPFKIPGNEIGERRRHPLKVKKGFQSLYEWDGNKWILIREARKSKKKNQNQNQGLFGRLKNKNKRKSPKRSGY